MVRKEVNVAHRIGVIQFRTESEILRIAPAAANQNAFRRLLRILTPNLFDGTSRTHLCFVASEVIFS
jgi:hypothetical protein